MDMILYIILYFSEQIIKNINAFLGSSPHASG